MTVAVCRTTGRIPGHRRRLDPPVYRHPLSNREHEVARLLGQGLSDRAIAADLFLSPKTVEKHVSEVLRKTATTSRTAPWSRASAKGGCKR